MEHLYQKIASVLCDFPSLLKRLSVVELRRGSIKLYKGEAPNPFEYVLAKILILGLLIFIVGMGIAISNDANLMTVIMVAIGALPLAYQLQRQELKRLIEKRDREVTIEFSRFSSNCVLFLSSGMSVRRAFSLSSKCIERKWIKNYVDKAVTDLNLNSNTSEIFCELNEKMRHQFVAEFTSVLEQTERYGIGGGSDLERLISQSWQLRKDTANQAAKELETKLVFPSMLIFFGVMIMVAAGLLMQLSS